MLDNQPGGEEQFLLQLATTLSEQGFNWGADWFNQDFANCTSRDESGITNCPSLPRPPPPPPPPACAGCPLPGPATSFDWGAYRFQTFDKAAWRVQANGSLGFVGA